MVAFVEEIARTEGKTVHVVWDNLNKHKDGPNERWTAFNARHGVRFHVRYTPVHGSCVNRVEVCSAIVQGRVLKNAVHNRLDKLDADVLAFLDHWICGERKPFRWTFKGQPCRTGSARHGAPGCSAASTTSRSED
jgi:hypothetical protein